MNEIIIVKPEKCVGCNACVRSCPAAEANITRQLDDGRFIRINYTSMTYPVQIDGVDIDDLFDGLMYAG